MNMSNIHVIILCALTNLIIRRTLTDVVITTSNEPESEMINRT